MEADSTVMLFDTATKNDEYHIDWKVIIKRETIKLFDIKYLPKLYTKSKKPCVSTYEKIFDDQIIKSNTLINSVLLSVTIFIVFIIL